MFLLAAMGRKDTESPAHPPASSSASRTCDIISFVQVAIPTIARLCQVFHTLGLDIYNCMTGLISNWPPKIQLIILFTQFHACDCKVYANHHAYPLINAPQNVSFSICTMLVVWLQTLPVPQWNHQKNPLHPY